MHFSSKRIALPARRSLLDTRHLSPDDLYSLFQIADDYLESGFKPATTAKIVCCLFFEPSTRTRMSFQAATYRLGHQLMTMDLGSTSSLSKGETDTDTVLNVVAMKPDLLVIRHGESPALDRILPELPIPVISAGNGVHAHPTQALLDAYTIYKERGQVEGEKVLLVGDIRHSRVARSNFDVLRKLGAQVGICGPETFLPDAAEIPHIRIFTDLDEALSWATVYMGLRIQLERHDAAQKEPKLGNGRETQTDYHRRYGLTDNRLKKLAGNALILHPGPVNRGVEFSDAALADPRSKVLQQVSNGVLIRAALLSQLLESGAE